MIRHVVVFTWSGAADAQQRRATMEALRRLRQDVGGMTSLVVAEDAGLSDGNAPLAGRPQRRPVPDLRPDFRATRTFAAAGGQRNG
jgi:hypothetical protein